MEIQPIRRGCYGNRCKMYLKKKKNATGYVEPVQLVIWGGVHSELRQGRSHSQSCGRTACCKTELRSHTTFPTKYLNHV